VQVEGVDALMAALATRNPARERVFVYFSGKKDASGNSWCPDCVAGKMSAGLCAPFPPFLGFSGPRPQADPACVAAAWPVVEKVTREHALDTDTFIYVDVGDRATYVLRVAWACPTEACAGRLPNRWPRLCS
jgi:hypothetical protein